MPAEPASPLPAISPQTSQLIGYGLLFAAAAIGGKYVIDGLALDVQAAKERREFIGPVQEIPVPVTAHVRLSDCVRFVATCVSVYTMLAELPSLVAEFGQVEQTIQELTK